MLKFYLVIGLSAIFVNHAEQRLATAKPYSGPVVFEGQTFFRLGSGCFAAA
jgi:hypothetical protein